MTSKYFLAMLSKHLTILPQDSISRARVCFSVPYLTVISRDPSPPISKLVVSRQSWRTSNRFNGGGSNHETKTSRIWNFWRLETQAAWARVGGSVLCADVFFYPICCGYIKCSSIWVIYSAIIWTTEKVHFLCFGLLQKHKTIYIYIYSHLYIHVNTMRRIPSNLPFSVIFATMVKPPWGAGKSTLVQAFLSEAAAAEAESGPTVGADFKVRTLKHAGKDRPWAMEMRSGWSGSTTPVTVLFFCLRI